MATRKDLGPVTAYAIAVANGFSGTEAEWTAYIQRAGEAGGYADQAQQSAEEAAQSAATFETDTTLAVAGKAADAGAVGIALNGFDERATDLETATAAGLVMGVVGSTLIIGQTEGD